MANVTNTLVANVTSTEDTTGNVDVNRGTGNPTYDSSACQFTSYQHLLNGIPAIPPFPIVPVTQVYVRNMSAVGSGLDLKVTWTPNGGASCIVVTLSPGGQIILFDNPGAAGHGITSLTLAAVGASVDCEWLMGG